MSDLPLIKTFNTGDRIYVQAQRVWLVLVSFVMQREKSDRRTLTYGDLAERMGYDRRAGITMHRALGIVGALCKSNNLPTLNSIVVNDATGLPGDHVVLRDGHSVQQEQTEVLRTDWFKYRVPTTGTFRQVWEAIS